MIKKLENLTNQEQAEIKKVFEIFKYLNDAHDVGPALRWFKHSINLQERELELILLNYLHLYETKMKDKPLKESIGQDIGLLGLLSGYERIRGVAGFDGISSQLSRMNTLYNKWCAYEN